MKNFLQLAGGLHVMPLLMEVKRQPDLWNENKLRTTAPGSPHSEVEDIWLMFNDTNQHIEQGQLFKNIANDKDIIPYRAWKDLPAARGIIFPLMSQVQAHRLGRVIITKLAPGCEIDPHIDGGAPAEYFQRFQVALQCLPGNKFGIENEEVEFRSGDVWYIDNCKTHWVINNSTDDRIVMIVDLRID